MDGLVYRSCILEPPDIHNREIFSRAEVRSRRWLCCDALLLPTMDRELEAKIQEVQKHIQTEVKILNASKAFRQVTTNQKVLQQNEAKIRETERSLSYFQDTLRELQTRQNSLSGPPVPNKQSHGGAQPPRPAGQAGKKYSKLELLMVDTPYTPAKISTMLSQLEFKLKVEEQYKQGSDKMAKLYQAEGDKKSKQDADGKRIEIERKIQLLGTALKRYKNLHVLDADEEDIEGQSILSRFLDTLIRSVPVP